MRIGFDGLTITTRPAGVGGTARDLLTALARLPGGHDLAAVLPTPSALDGALGGLPGIRPLRAPVAGPDTVRSLLFQHVQMPRLLRAAGADVHLAPAYVVPLRAGATPSAVIVYDASWRRFPETKSRRFRAYMERMVPSSMRRAAAVIAPSEFSADEARELAPDAADKVRVVPLGLPPRPLCSDPAPLLAKLGVDPPYLLSVSNFDPRKNLPALVTAWRRLRADGALPHALVLAGSPERAARLRSQVGVRQDEPLHTPGYVSDAELAALYAAAALVVVPSIYEGFGLPVLEAFAAGAPVACADAGSLPEVAGGAAVLFDPHDPDAIADGIRAALLPGAERDERVRHGRERAGAHTWERTARGVLEILSEISPA